MSGVYIKGMEMPKNCEDCPCVDYKNWRCQVDDLWDKEHCPDSGRPDWCPLVPVPPHGRLIDADSFESFIRNNWDKYDQWFVKHLEARPTIIPAEEGE